MKQYKTFIFESYVFDEQNRTIELNYSLDDEVPFTERITIPEGMELRITEPAALDRALFALHLIGGISYFKTCLPKKIDVRSGELTAEQAAFWNSVYENGLGEFFYQNKIDFRGLINFPAEASHGPTITKSDNRKVRVLTPFGGGKDSLVTVEMLKKGCFPQTLMRVGGHPFITTLAKVTGQPLLTINRALSAELFKLNADGALNGHVPITAYLSFLSIVLGEMLGFSHVVFSNEGSASEGNVEMFGKMVNHQWSKSAEFENDFRAYVQTFISRNVEYFSLIRPLSELKVVELFVQYPQYIPLFTSCNANWKILKDQPTNRWCGHCPKCAFAFAMLAAFVPKEEVINAFNDNNLFSDESLLPLFRELLGLEGIKPFECVGTPEETAAAFVLAQRQGGWDKDAAMMMFTKEYLPTVKDADALIKKVLTPGPADSVPEKFRTLLPTA